MRTSVVSVCVLVLGLASAAGASELEGTWQVRGERNGSPYTGEVIVEERGSSLNLTWSVQRDSYSERLNGRIDSDEEGFFLFKAYGFGQRLRRFFTGKRSVKYQGAIQRVSASEFRVALSSGGSDAGSETWTRGATTPTPTPSPQPQPDPLPAPNELPFIHPDRFVPQPGTDVWHVEFNEAKFRRDMQSHGLLSGDPITDRAMLLRLQSLILQSANEKYRRTRRGEAVPGQSWKISFTARAPRADADVFPGVANPRVGVHYSRMEVGGTDGGTHGRVPSNDHGNSRKEDNSGSRWGVFAGSISGSDSRLDPPLTAADRPYVDGTYLLGDGDAAQDRRFMRVQEVSADWAYALSSTLAHEIGHSVGCPHTGRTFWGRVVRAGPRLSLMRHKKNRSILSDRGTRFYSDNQRRLDQNLQLDR